MVRDQTTAMITVAYHRDPGLGWLVPFEMREWYAYPYVTLTAVAEYRKLRQFQTSVRIVEPPDSGSDAATRQR
jgi:hypothetical protein